MKWVEREKAWLWPMLRCNRVIYQEWVENHKRYQLI